MGKMTWTGPMFEVPVLTEAPSDLDLVEHHAGREAYYRGLLEQVKRKITEHQQQKEAALERIKHPVRRPENAGQIVARLAKAAKAFL